MQVDDYIRLGQVAIETAVWVSAPILAMGLAVGIVVLAVLLPIFELNQLIK